MLGLPKRFMSGVPEPPAEGVRLAAPASVESEGAIPFDLPANLTYRDAIPLLDWEAVRAWVLGLPADRQDEAWLGCERAWLLHLRDALGPAFRVEEGETAIVLSSLEPRLAGQALDFMHKTLRRIVRVLDGVAESSDWGKDILILFDDEDGYYRYVSLYGSGEGEQAFSSGMHIDHGCSHFVAPRGELVSLEPVIAHEMAHGCVAHLPLPLWLNEGLAVNTAHRVTSRAAPLFTPLEMHAKHLRFWTGETLQQFWSGASFRRPDEGNMLSYDLARVIVEQLSADWPRFAAFVREARWQDSGAAAARAHLDATLGAIIAAILEREPSPAFEPEPTRWGGAAETVPAASPLT